MKRIFLIAIVICFISGILNGCETKENSNDKIVQIVVDETGCERVNIPNPENYKEDDRIVLPYVEKVKDKKVDLAFCGFYNEVKVKAFEIGNIIKTQSLVYHVCHKFSDDFKDNVKLSETRDKRIIGNCIILLVTDCITEENYIVILDYTNGKRYVIKTIVENYGEWFPQLTLSDVTGDGLEDIIVSNYRNIKDTGLVCEIFRFDDNKLKSIYTSETIGENDVIERRGYFTGYLEDNYILRIESSQIGYEEKISLLDIGYSRKKLERKESENKEDIYSKSYYKNGKVLKSINRKTYISPLDYKNGIQVLENSNMKSGIRFMYRIYMPNRIDYIGKVYAYMNYNDVADSLKITAARVEFELY